MADTKRQLGQQEKVYPEVFDLRAMPKQPEEKKPGQLPDSMIKQFFEEVSINSFPYSDFQPLIRFLLK